MSIDTTAEVAAGQIWRERKTRRVIIILTAENPQAGGARVRYWDAESCRRNSLLINALKARFERVE